MAVAVRYSWAEHIIRVLLKNGKHGVCMGLHAMPQYVTNNVSRHNTTVTVQLLESVMLQVKTDQAGTMCILQVMNPVASCLFNNDSGANYDVDEVIQQLRSMIPVTPAGGEDHETL